MYRIICPYTGQKGFFCSSSEKAIIDAVLVEYQENQLVTTSNVDGGVNE